jgi:hypothetical protein
MFGIFFSILVVVALLSIFGEFVMRVRLTRRTSGDKIAWWRRGGDEIASTTQKYSRTADSPYSGVLSSGCSLPAVFLSLWLCRGNHTDRLPAGEMSSNLTRKWLYFAA